MRAYFILSKNTHSFLPLSQHLFSKLVITLFQPTAVTATPTARGQRTPTQRPTPCTDTAEPTPDTDTGTASATTARGPPTLTPTTTQVWPLASYQQLPSLRLSPLKGFLSWHGALQEPLTCLECCFQKYRETMTASVCAALGVEVSGHRQKQLT